MKRREFLKSTGLAAAAAATTGCWTPKRSGPGLRKGPKRPNVVFILTDDQRWDLMGCAGHPFLKTPNLDRIADEGALFEKRGIHLTQVASTYSVSRYEDFPRPRGRHRLSTESSGV